MRGTVMGGGWTKRLTSRPIFARHASNAFGRGVDANWVYDDVDDDDED